MKDPGDLTPTEQERVRAALHFLRRQLGTIDMLAKLLKVTDRSLGYVWGGRTVTPTLAFRTARIANVSLDDLLAGKFPEDGACPYCGHRKAVEDAPPQTA